MNKGTLFLIPTTLGPGKLETSLPGEVLTKIDELDCFAVEKVKTARRFLKKVNRDRDIDSTSFFILNKKSSEDDVLEILQELLMGKDVGMLSEAGAPAVADPGSLLVKMAHENKIKVVPFVGPSSILLALMASGLNGQSFTFHGYLPRDEKDRKQKLLELERLSSRHHQTQIFIETPYRNNQMIKSIVETCSPKTHICVAANITTDQEKIMTKTASEWKNKTPDFNKQPAVFLIQAS